MSIHLSRYPLLIVATSDESLLSSAARPVCSGSTKSRWKMGIVLTWAEGYTAFKFETIHKLRTTSSRRVCDCLTKRRKEKNNFGTIKLRFYLSKKCTEQNEREPYHIASVCCDMSVTSSHVTPNTHCFILKSILVSPNSLFIELPCKKIWLGGNFLILQHCWLDIYLHNYTFDLIH